MNIYYVAAKETMVAGLLPRIMACAGAIITVRELGEQKVMF
jgi:hypothetical protein